VEALLGSTEEPMRFAAACALSDQGDAAALPQLLAALREDYLRAVPENAATREVCDDLLRAIVT